MPDVNVIEEVKCFGVSTSLYFIFDETWENKLSLEIGCSQGLVYGFTRYDDNHERANKLISFRRKLNFDFVRLIVNSILFDFSRNFFAGDFLLN